MKTGLNINSKQTAGLPLLFLTMFVISTNLLYDRQPGNPDPPTSLPSRRGRASWAADRRCCTLRERTGRPTPAPSRPGLRPTASIDH